MSINNQRGNSMIIAIFFIAIILIIFMFMMVVFIGEVNSLAHNIKLDMYSINKSAIISVNKGITNRNGFSYSKDAYKEYFINMLKKNYSLNDDLKNDTGLVKSVEILQYDIYKSRKERCVYSKQIN